MQRGSSTINYPAPSHVPTSRTNSLSSVQTSSAFSNNGPRSQSPFDMQASDFPALGSTANYPFSSAFGGIGVGISGTSNSAPTAASIAASGLPSHHSSTGSLQQQREFSADDFPALGSTGSNTAPPTDSSIIPLNGILSASARSQQQQQSEQAAAVTALVHRQGLLGSLASSSSPVLSSSGPPPGVGLRNVSGQSISAEEAKRSYALKLNQQQNWQSQNAPLNGTLPSSLPNGLPPGVGTTQTATNTNGITLQQRVRSPSQSQTSQTGSTSLPSSGQIQNRPLSSIARHGILPNGNSSTLSNATTTTTVSNANAEQIQQQVQALTQAAAPQGPTPIPQTPAQQVLFSPADRFGLLGLLNLIKMSDPDTSMLTLGTDLSKLGLDLSRRDNLSSSFVTPWTDSEDQASSTAIEPEFTLPSCYIVHPPSASTKIGQFSDETLFFIFYTQPRDVIQEAAASELYKHNWRFHKELKLWLTKESGSEPSQKTSTYERGTYVFFDPQTWEKVKKEFVLVYDNLAPARAAETRAES